MATKKPTPAQLAARKEFARIMKSGGFAKNPAKRKPAAKKAAPKRNPVKDYPYSVTWTSAATGSHRSSTALNLTDARRDAAALKKEGAKDVQIIKFDRKAHAARKVNPRGLPTPTVSHSNKVYLLEVSRDGKQWDVQHAFASPHFATSKAHAMAADAPRYHFRVRDIRVSK